MAQGEKASRGQSSRASNVGSRAQAPAPEGGSRVQAPFADEQPSGTRHKPLSDSSALSDAHESHSEVRGATPSERWSGTRYVQLTLDGQALCASEGFSTWIEEQRITAELGEAVRLANGAQRGYSRFADVDVQLVRMNHRTGGYYLAVLTRAELPERVVRLSGMQERVALLAARGDTSGQIGTQLGVSANTVKFHLKRVYELLGVSNRIELRRALDASQLARRAVQP